MVYQVGDPRLPKLTINPFDGNTVVTLTVVCVSTGVSSVKSVTGPVAGPLPGDGVWTMAGLPYTFTSAGRWVERWKATNAVTGIGAGAENFKLDVEATEPPLGPGQTAAWATVDDYANIIGNDLPDGLARKLRIATIALRAETGLDLYVTTDPLVLAAMKEACCEQVKYAADNGWDSGAPGLQRAVSIGSVSLGATSNSQAGGSGLSPVSPIAVELLTGVGLIAPFITTQPTPLWW